MSGAGEVAVVARYQVKPGQGDEVARLLRGHVAASRAEPGCLQFTVLRSAEDPDSFLLYERYVSREAVDAHRASPHFAAIAQARIWPLLADRSADLYQPLPME